MVRKVTFTLDERTVQRISHAAESLHKAKSEVVREAIADYHDRLGSLSERERLRLLQVFDHVVPLIPVRPLSAAMRGQGKGAGKGPGFQKGGKERGKGPGFQGSRR